MIVKDYQLLVKEVDGRKFYYIDFGSEHHGRNSFRLWVHFRLINWQNNGNGFSPHIRFPLEGARIDRGKKNRTLILRPDKYYWVTEVFIPCGYHGDSDFKVAERDVVIYPYYIHRSPRKPLGISKGALLQIPAKLDAVTVEWTRTGKLYGNALNGTFILHKNGSIESPE